MDARSRARFRGPLLLTVHAHTRQARARTSSTTAPPLIGRRGPCRLRRGTVVAVVSLFRQYMRYPTQNSRVTVPFTKANAPEWHGTIQICTRSRVRTPRRRLFCDFHVKAAGPLVSDRGGTVSCRPRLVTATPAPRGLGPACQRQRCRYAR